MRIVIWKIREKKSEKSPDYQGYIDDGSGKKTNIVLWVRKSEKGNTYLSGKEENSTQEKKDTKKDNPSQQVIQPEQKSSFEPKKTQKFDFDVDDDLPF